MWLSRLCLTSVLASRFAKNNCLPGQQSFRVNTASAISDTSTHNAYCEKLSLSLIYIPSPRYPAPLSCKMFSSSANSVPQAPPTRSSRRRQRPLSSESISQPKAKRQRSALNDQTFVAPDGSPEMQEVKALKSIGSLTRRENPRAGQTPRRELAVRGKKPKLAERGSKGDGSVVLVCAIT